MRSDESQGAPLISKFDIRFVAQQSNVSQKYVRFAYQGVSIPQEKYEAIFKTVARFHRVVPQLPPTPTWQPAFLEEKSLKDD